MPVRPEDVLAELVDRLHATEEPDFEVISDVGCGELENLIRGHGVELWPEVERLARADPVFRRALRSVWAYDSPEFERRDQLLGELGEHWPVLVRFVVQPDDFLPEPRVSWRAVQIEGEPPAGQLGRLLREIADWYERDREEGNPHVVVLRKAWPIYYKWRQAMDALERATHRVAVARDAGSFRSAMEAVEQARAVEQNEWRDFVARTTDEEAGST